MSVQIRPIPTTQIMLGILVAISSISHAAERYGVIEIGSTGVRGIACNVNKDSVGNIKPSASKKYAPLNVELLAQWNKAENKFSGQGYDQAISRIEELVREMNVDGIPNDSILMFISSGLDAAAGKDQVSKREKVSPFGYVSMSPVLSQLRKDIPKFGPVEIQSLSADEEATLAFVGNVRLIPDSPWKYLVDIGGGNTKGALQLASGKLDSKMLGDGVRAITTKDPNANPEAKDPKAVDEALKEVREGVVNQSQGIGRVDGRTYVVGGISFIVATIAEAKHGRRTVDNDDFFTISRSDIDEFLGVVAPQGRALKDGKQLLFDAYIDKFANSGDPLLASLQQAKQIPYTPDGLKNGANLLLAVLDGLKKSGVTRADELVFVRSSLYSIAIAYCESKIPVDDSLPRLLDAKKSEIETQIKDLEKKIDKSIRDKSDEQTSLLRGDLEKIRSEIASINASIKSQGDAVRMEIRESSNQVLKELKDLKQSFQQGTTQRMTSLPPNDRDSAVLLLSEALRHRKSGNLDMARAKLDQAITHSVMESDIWLVRAMIAKELGDDRTAQDSILAAAKLIESGSFSKSKLGQSLERVQGASRASAETDLLAARMHLASIPTAYTRK